MKIPKERLVGPIMISVIFMLIISFVLMIYNFFNRAFYGIDMFEIDNFIYHKKSFDVIAKKMIDFYNSEKSTNNELKKIMVDPKGDDTWILRYTFYNSVDDYALEVKMSTEEKQVYKKVRELIDDSISDSNKYKGEFSFIVVTENKVKINTASPYRIIYMEKGSKQDIIDSEKGKADFILVEKIAHKWYQYITK